MSDKKHKTMALIVASGAMTGVALAGENATPGSSTETELQALKARVAQLEAESKQTWLSPSHSEELHALMEDVVSDSNRRTSLLSANGMGGWDNGFYLSSDDGAFLAKFFFQAQFRAVWNIRDNSGGDDSIFGFSNRRTKAGVKGNLFNEDFTYKINGAFSNNGGVFGLEDAWAAYQLNENTNIQWGQFKAPFLSEELHSSTKLLGTSRSFVNELATQNRTQGVQVGFEQDQFSLDVAFTDGWVPSIMGTNGSGQNIRWNSDATEYAITGRAEYIVQGESKKQFKDYQSATGDEMGILLGAAVHWQDGEHGTAAFETEYFGWTVDAQVELGGAHVEGYVVGQHFSSDAPGFSDVDQIGFVVSGGIFLDEEDMYEIFGRFEWYDFDNGVMPAGYEDDISLITGGLNVFWAGHSRRWSTDVVFALDPIYSGSSSLGLLSDAANQDGQFVIRSQYQFLF